MKKNHLYYRVSQNHGNSGTNSILSLLWTSIVMPNFKSHNMSARVYSKNNCKRLKRCVYNVSARWTVKTDKFTLLVYCNFLDWLNTTVCILSINKQNVNISHKTFTYYCFLSRYHYTKSKNYFKRRYQIRHWIPMFIATPCILFF